MVSALLGFMAVSGMLGQRNLASLEVRCRLVSEAFAGLPAQFRVELSNRRKFLPAFLILVQVGEQKLLFPLLAPGEKSEKYVVLNLAERGLRRLPEIRLSSRFPINFFVRSKQLFHQQQALVYPHPLSIDDHLAGDQPHSAPQESLEQPGLEGDLRSIDGYREGDPLKSIHWKHSARHEEHKVKRHHRLGAPLRVLDLDSLPGTLEERLSRCSYLVSQLSRTPQAIGLRLGDRRIPPASGPVQRQRLLSALALYARD